MSHGPIDHAVLATLMRELDDVDGEMCKALIASYLVESAEQVRSLVAGGQAADAVGAARVAHSLRSSSALLGATELAGLLAGLEASADEPNGLVDRVAQVEAEHQRVIVSLEALQMGEVVVA